jgi:hypothetical protein
MHYVGGSMVGDMVFTMGVYRLELTHTNANPRTLALMSRAQCQYSRKSRVGERAARRVCCCGR